MKYCDYNVELRRGKATKTLLEMLRPNVFYLYYFIASFLRLLSKTSQAPWPLQQRITPYFFPYLCPPIFQNNISNYIKSHNDNRKDTPSKEEFIFMIQTNPALKALVYLIGAANAEDCRDKAVYKEKTYTPNVFWFQLAPSGIIEQNSKTHQPPLRPA